MKKPNYYRKITTLLTELKKDHPDYNLGRHIETALSNYGSLFSVPDEEFYTALANYKNELDIDTHSDADLQRIINDANNLDSILDDDEEDTYFDY